MRLHKRAALNDPVNTNLPPILGRRIAIIGVTGSGKTTLAGQISNVLHIPHVELDSLHWGPNWTMAETGVFREQVRQALAYDEWVTDGNYSKARDIIWGRADTIVWLDYKLPVILWQLLIRTLRRIITREVLWNSNRETWTGALIGKDSLLRFAIQTHPKHRKIYPQAFKQPENAHLQVIRLKSRGETHRWLAELNNRAAHTEGHITDRELV